MYFGNVVVLCGDKKKKKKILQFTLITRTVNKTTEHQLEEQHCKEHITLISQDDFLKKMYAEDIIGSKNVH